MIGHPILKCVSWTFFCFCIYVLAGFLTQFGDPATDGAKTFQDWSGFAIIIVVPAVWIFGCLKIFRSRAR